jgi:hypothetical protein
MVVFYFKIFVSGFAALIHFFIHPAFLVCCLRKSNAGRFELVAAIELFYTKAKCGSSINADQQYQDNPFHPANIQSYTPDFVIVIVKRLCSTPE